LDIHQFFELSGWIVGVIGLAYAWYTNRESAKVKDHARAEAWNLYLAANTACGNVQEALKLYKGQHAGATHPDVLESLSKADAKSLSVYHGAVRQIQWAEPRFDLESIDYWVELGKVIPVHRESFVKIMVHDKPRRRSDQDSTGLRVE
jgi:hypothetical protein